MYSLDANHERRLLWLLALTQFTIIMDFMVMMPLGPQIMHSFGITPAEFATAVSAYSWCSGLSGLFAATYIDRFDRRRLLLAMYALFALSNLACALANSFHLLLAARAFAGITGGVLASVDDKAARAIPGVIDVLRIKDAVAVVGEHFWAAKRGLEALKLKWTPGRNATLTTQQLRAALADALAKDKAIVGKETGKRPEGTLVQATYDLPMLAHATMEPLNTTVHVRPDGCDIWVGTQVPARCVGVAAKITGLAEDKVVLHNQYLGGGFGRRLETDSVEQAVAFAKQVPYPLKVVWTREEDIRHDIVRPMYHDEISAVVDGEGRIQWFGDRISGGTVLGRWAPAFMGKDGMDGDLIECVAEPCYDLPNLKVEWVRHDMPAGLNVGWWRGVGPTHNLFVMESFIDELAQRAKKDPVAYRRAMLQ